MAFFLYQSMEISNVLLQSPTRFITILEDHMYLEKIQSILGRINNLSPGRMPVAA